MKSFHLAFCIPFLVNAASAKAVPSPVSDGFSISINLKGLADGTKLYLLAKTDADLESSIARYRDTIAVTTASKEKASFNEAIVNKGKLYIVTIEGQTGWTSLLVSSKEKISVRGSLEEWPKVNVSGSKSTAQMLDFQSYLSNKIMNQKGVAIGEGILAFADSHPNNLYLPLVVLQNAGMTKEEKKAALEKLSPVARNSYYGSLLSKAIFNNKIAEPLREGNLIPEFRVRMLDGDTVSVREIAKKNKLTLIDFWGTWCGPCVAEFPFLKDVYTRFKDKGFSILGITRKENEQGWRKAIDNHGINWQHGADDVDDAGPKIFKLNSIPAYALVDQDGKMIAFLANGSRASEPFGPVIWRDGLIKALEERLK